ncbi:patatin-like phospholipase family protein [Caballeronia sp. 15715]|uniref:patatin-like phospholipase family protein n=1 Tax=Caballeronia sp. 15715 TaxID=3391030 RepID=UPI0039E38E94
MTNPNAQLPTNDGAGVPFETVVRDEIEDINVTRNLLDTDARPAATSAGGTRLTGLALSGGGIRSATFCLGVIQSLSETRLLRQFDYLSTVSGGGYIGAWLSAQIYRRCKSGTPAELEEKLSPTQNGCQKDTEDPSIVFLREYSNYLTPRLGLLSTDTLAAIAAYLRNLTLIQGMLILLMSFLLLVPRVVFFLASVTQRLAVREGTHAAGLAVVGMVALVGVLLWLSIWAIRRNMSAGDGEFAGRTGFVLGLILAPGVVASFILAVAMAILATLEKPAAHDTAVTWIVVFLIIFGVGSMLIPAERKSVDFDLPAVDWTPQSSAAAGESTPQSSAEPVESTPQSSAEADDNGNGNSTARRRNRGWIVFFGLLAGATGGFALWLVRGLVSAAYATFGGDASAVDATLWVAISVAPFLILTVLSLIIIVHLGLVGRMFEYEVQEWWARYGGWLIAIIVFAGGIFVASVYGPALVVFGENWARAGGAAWLLASLWGVLKGTSNKTSGEGPSWTERALVVVPYVFIVGLSILLSYAIHEIWQSALVTRETVLACVEPAKGHSRAYLCLLDSMLNEMTEQTRHPVGGSCVPAVLIVIVGVASAWTLLSLRVDVNLFSLHNFYRNRLIRCYLGASRSALKTRKPDPFTGFDPADDIPLDRLAARRISPQAKDTFVQRPYHILNTTVNLTEGENLAWQQRKGGSFFFSPRHCGFGLPQAYVSGQEQAGTFLPTANYMRGTVRGGHAHTTRRQVGTRYDVGPMLGGAVAISGAAASPNWGFHTDPGVAFLLTLFNVRLGRWCPNPVRYAPKKPVSPNPIFSGALYINELFGHANGESDYLYLSDGGHFDNLGLYELVRRRTQVIVVCDCGEDAPLRFDDLADTIRKCSADFGVDIVIDVDPLRHLETPDKRPPPQSGAYVVDGVINYPASTTGTTGTNAPAFQGTLLLVKPTLTKEVISTASDLMNYALSNATFPQQTTLDQWFDEAQFESYRKLGYLIGRQLQTMTFTKQSPEGASLAELLRNCTGIK